MKNSSKNIKVLHLLSGFTVGGAEKLLLDIVKNNKDPKIQYNIYILKNVIEKTIYDELNKQNCKIILLNKSKKYSIIVLIKLLYLILKNKIQIIHTHEGAKHWSMICKILLPTLKLVYTSHGNYEFVDMSKFKLFLHKTFIDQTIVISEPIRKACENFDVNKITVINNGIDINKYSIEKDNSDESCFKILNVSRIVHTIKAQDVLIKAIKECKNKNLNVKCYLAGGKDQYEPDSYDYLQKMVEDFDLKDNVEFLGVRMDVPELLSKSDVFILPSRTEAMPLSILEAMASHTPVIASDIPGSKALIDQGVTGLLFKSEDYVDLSNHIHELYFNKEKAKIIAKNAFEYVQRFDIKVMVEKYHELYRNIIE